MPYTRNIAFTSLIKVNGRLREFNFRKRSESLYDGDTNDERGERYFFKVENVDHQWTLIGTNMPSWLTENELAIKQEISKQDEATVNQSGLIK
jgi:hypothetical protein